MSIHFVWSHSILGGVNIHFVVSEQTELCPRSIHVGNVNAQWIYSTYILGGVGTCDSDPWKGHAANRKHLIVRPT